MKIVKPYYEKLYGKDYCIVQSPGRINLLGEHVDYNGGKVLPMAINKYITIGIGSRKDQKIHLYAINFMHEIICEIDEIEPSQEWSAYIYGVVDQLIKKGKKINGFNMVIRGDIPLGGGLSSSAALTCSTAYGLNEIFNLSLTKKEIAVIAQQAESTFTGVQCGLMDQYASLFGKENHIIDLDCRSLEHTYIPTNMQSYQMVIFNTSVNHHLGFTEYNKRQIECKQGVEWIKEHVPSVQSLRDVSLDMLDQYVKPKDDIIYKRCLYVVQEMQRVHDAIKDLHAGDMTAVGKKMYITHEGLSKDYEVSCTECDFIVDYLKTTSATIGARMIGGGFGGSVLGLVKKSEVMKVISTLSTLYKKEMKLDLITYIVDSSNATRIINHHEHTNKETSYVN